MSKYALDFSTAYPKNALKADFKLAVEDFRVSERLGFEPSAQGEHLFLRISKNNLTTDRLVDDIAKILNLHIRDIGYCGLKDKHGITEQWISVVWPIKKELPDISGNKWQVLEAVRHDKKLKRGVHKGNDFVVRLQNIQGDMSQLEDRLIQIANSGFPNYFGEQRFGFRGENVEKAELLFGRKLKCRSFERSIYYSAARSYLFNKYLSLRVKHGIWNVPLPGDCFNLEGSNSVFGPEQITEEILQRMASFDIHPMGVLFGTGSVRLAGDALHFFEQVTDCERVLVEGLVAADVKSALRPLRVMAKSLNWKIVDQCCELQFFLPSGSYATALLRELVSFNEEVW